MTVRWGGTGDGGTGEGVCEEGGHCEEENCCWQGITLFGLTITLVALKLAAFEHLPISRPYESGLSLSAMSSMYGLQTSSDMNHLHGVCDPHMNGLSLQVRVSCATSS